MEDRKDLFEKIVEKMIDEDLLNVIDYDVEHARALAYSILECTLVDYYIVEGNLL